MEKTGTKLELWSLSLFADTKATLPIQIVYIHGVEEIQFLQLWYSVFSKINQQYCETSIWRSKFGAQTHRKTYKLISKNLKN